MPKEIVLQLSHKDVFLDYFKKRKREILALRSGDTLNYSTFYLYVPTTNTLVARVSRKMQNYLLKQEGKGYKVKTASVRFIVAWKPKDALKTEDETAVLLIDLVLTL